MLLAGEGGTTGSAFGAGMIAGTFSPVLGPGVCARPAPPPRTTRHTQASRREETRFLMTMSTEDAE